MPRPFLDRVLKKDDAILLPGIEIVALGKAERRLGLDELLGEGVAHNRVRDRQFALAPMRGAFASLLVFAALEERQNIAPAPSGVAALRPVVEIARMTANIEHAVDRPCSRQPLAAGPVHRAVLKLGLRLGGISPIVGAGLEDP